MDLYGGHYEKEKFIFNAQLSQKWKWLQVKYTYHTGLTKVIKRMGNAFEFSIYKNLEKTLDAKFSVCVVFVSFQFFV